jgi:predicted O-methyltransferase YrrM
MPGKPLTRRDRIDPTLDYATRLSGPVPDYLLRIERQTHLTTVAPQQMSSRLQGRLLALLSMLTRPGRVLELGTFTGYGALCLAEGLAAGGYVDTIEGDAETARRAERLLAQTPLADRIRIHTGQAGVLLDELRGPYGMIFLDADKRGYPDYLPLLIGRLLPGGLLLADNVLWDGKTGRGVTTDPVVDALRRFNTAVAEDDRLQSLTLPLRDGLTIARRVD